MSSHRERILPSVSQELIKSNIEDIPDDFVLFLDELGFLFICQHNVGRSQMAEGKARRVFGSTRVRSAGVSKLYRGHPTEKIQRAMRNAKEYGEEGIDISRQIITRLTEYRLKQLQKRYKHLMVIVLCKRELLPRFLIDSGVALVDAQIPDPDTSTDAETEKIRDQAFGVVNDVAWAIVLSRIFLRN